MMANVFMRNGRDSLEEQAITPILANLGFPSSYSEIDLIVIGVKSLVKMEMIIPGLSR